MHECQTRACIVHCVISIRLILARRTRQHISRSAYNTTRLDLLARDAPLRIFLVGFLGDPLRQTSAENHEHDGKMEKSRPCSHGVSLVCPEAEESDLPSQRSCATMSETTNTNPGLTQGFIKRRCWRPPCISKHSYRLSAPSPPVSQITRDVNSLPVIQIPLENNQIAVLQILEQFGCHYWHILIRILCRPEPSHLILLSLTKWRVKRK